MAFWFFRRFVRTTERMLKDVENELRNTKETRIAFLKQSQEELNKFKVKLQDATDNYSKLMKQAEESMKQAEESMKHAIRTDDLVWNIGRLSIDDPNQKNLAVIALAQGGNPRAIPFLLEILRNPGWWSRENLTQALRGLGNFFSTRRDGVTSDISELILNASRHAHKSVRLAAVESMGTIDPQNASFQTRLVEIINNDVDNDVKLAAKKILEIGQA